VDFMYSVQHPKGTVLEGTIVQLSNKLCSSGGLVSLQTLLSDHIQSNPVKTFLKIPRKSEFLGGRCLKRVGMQSSIFFFNLFVNLLHMYAEFV
jgi:hypothetical protein